MPCYPLIMELRFDVILYSKLASENSYAGHIKCSRGQQVPRPCTTVTTFVRWYWNVCEWTPAQLLHLYITKVLALVNWMN